MSSSIGEADDVAALAAEIRPSLHQEAALVKMVGALVGVLHLALGNMPETALSAISRGARAFSAAHVLKELRKPWQVTPRRNPAKVSISVAIGRPRSRPMKTRSPSMEQPVEDFEETIGQRHGVGSPAFIRSPGIRQIASPRSISPRLAPRHS